MKIMYLLIFVNLSAMAMDKNSEFAVLGRGTISCGSVIEAYDNKDEVSKLAIEEWSNGYLTALNYSLSNTYDITGNIDVGGRSQWVLKYCRNNPLKTLSNASEGLAYELNKKIKASP